LQEEHPDLIVKEVPSTGLSRRRARTNTGGQDSIELPTRQSREEEEEEETTIKASPREVSMRVVVNCIVIDNNDWRVASGHRCAFAQEEGASRSALGDVGH
jgi:hypothetical protein